MPSITVHDVLRLALPPGTTVAGGSAGLLRQVTWVATPRATLPAFVNLRGGKRWLVKPNEGSIPYWILSEGRRVPGSRAGDYLKYAPLLWADKKADIGKIVSDRGPLCDPLSDKCVTSNQSR